MIILDDEVELKRIPAKQDTRIFRFFWKEFRLFKENGEEVNLEDTNLSITKI